MSITEDIKDEFAIVINERVSASSMSYRTLSSKVEELTPSLISRIHNYNLKGISIERLMKVLARLDALLYDIEPEFALKVDTENKVISVLYLNK
ncbi:conserved hypothetical protein [Vibrio chagasii]|nr:conserved hypothetical protein [Vibrio chagasii]